MLEKSQYYYSEYRKEMLKFLPSSANKILDVGCGKGTFASQLINKDTEVWGVEINPESVVIASGILFKVLGGKIEDEIANLPDNYFDVIFFNDVLEHLYEPWNIIVQIKQKLNNGGKLICSIPNVRYIRNMGKLLFEKDWKYTDSGILDITHLRFFTKKSMLRLFNETGFNVEVIKGINGTKSERLKLYTFLINIFTFSSHSDILYLQFAIVASKNN